MTDREIIQLAEKAGFGGNQRNTLLIKILLLARAAYQRGRDDALREAGRL